VFHPSHNNTPKCFLWCAVVGYCCLPGQQPIYLIWQTKRERCVLKIPTHLLKFHQYLCQHKTKRFPSPGNNVSGNNSDAEDMMDMNSLSGDEKVSVFANFQPKPIGLLNDFAIEERPTLPHEMFCLGLWISILNKM
jgi:hypothetical protein